MLEAVWGRGKGRERDKNGSERSPGGGWAADAVANGEVWRRNTAGTAFDPVISWPNLAAARSSI